MHDFKDYIDGFIIALGIKLNAFLAGIFGGLASMGNDNKLSFRRSFSLVFTGAFVAGYFTPVIEDHFKLSETWAGATSFLFGLIGMRITGGLIKLANQFDYDPIKFALSTYDIIKSFVKTKLK